GPVDRCFLPQGQRLREPPGSGGRGQSPKTSRIKSMNSLCTNSLSGFGFLMTTCLSCFRGGSYRCDRELWFRPRGELVSRLPGEDASECSAAPDLARRQRSA